MTTSYKHKGRSHLWLLRQSPSKENDQLHIPFSSSVCCSVFYVISTYSAWCWTRSDRLGWFVFVWGKSSFPPQAACERFNAWTPLKGARRPGSVFSSWHLWLWCEKTAAKFVFASSPLLLPASLCQITLEIEKQIRESISIQQCLELPFYGFAKLKNW